MARTTPARVVALAAATITTLTAPAVAVGADGNPPIRAELKDDVAVVPPTTTVGDRTPARPPTAPAPTARPEEPPTPTGTVYFRGDFEDGSLSPWGEQSCNSGLTTDVAVRSDGAAQGTAYARSTIAGPCSSFGIGKYRAELQSGSYRYSAGQTRYYDFYVRAPSTFPDLRKSHCSAIQWKDGSGGPPLALGCNGGALRFSNPPVAGWSTSIAKGQGWHHFVLKLLHDTDSNGRVTVWYAAPNTSALTRVIGNAAHPTLGDAPNYLKSGYYRGEADPASPSHYLDHDGMTVSSCHTVDPAC